jgi:nucleoside-diphosphate-sugar epimerase
MKVLVTGGSGYLGTHVRKYFDADDLSRTSGKDVLNLGHVASVRDYDMVIHLAAHLSKSPGEERRTFLVNVEGTVNILREMRERAAFVFASTKDVYGRFADNFETVNESCPTLYAGQTPLEWSKLIAERYVEYYSHQRGFRSCIFRLSTVYAPPTPGTTPNFVGHYADAIDRGEPLRLPGGGTPKRDLLYVDDLSRACQAFHDSVIKHGLYNLGGGPKYSMSLRELISAMEKVSSLQAVIKEDNPLPEPIPRNYISDLSLVMQELDWAPTVGISEGIGKLFQNSRASVDPFK